MGLDRSEFFFSRFAYPLPQVKTVRTGKGKTRENSISITVPSWQRSIPKESANPVEELVTFLGCRTAENVAEVDAVLLGAGWKLFHVEQFPVNGKGLARLGGSCLFCWGCSCAELWCFVRCCSERGASFVERSVPR